MDSKTKQQSLVDILHERRMTYEVETLLRLLVHMVEDGKTRLLACTVDDFVRVQAEVGAYGRIMNLILRPNLKNKNPSE